MTIKVRGQSFADAFASAQTVAEDRAAIFDRHMGASVKRQVRLVRVRTRRGGKVRTFTFEIGG